MTGAGTTLTLTLNLDQSKSSKNQGQCNFSFISKNDPPIGQFKFRFTVSLRNLRHCWISMQENNYCQFRRDAATLFFFFLFFYCSDSGESCEKEHLFKRFSISLWGNVAKERMKNRFFFISINKKLNQFRRIFFYSKIDAAETGSRLEIH